MLINGKITLDWARAFAGRVLTAAGKEPERLVERIYGIALGRGPTTKEAQLARDFLASQQKQLQERLANRQQILAPAGAPAGIDPAFAGAVVDLCHVMLNINEFAYVD